ncbi:MAG TPA: ABC transporter substrate-binding protein, partial [Steroidobacteraceae bacterium]|nr:ABC transporter substrate-binding protein [Steroidobacteraceae bacterium]
PQELVEEVSKALLKDLDADRESYRHDQKKLRALIDKHLLSHFDVDYSARLVLGKNWRTTTDAQHKRFIDAFYQSLLRNYGDAMLDFTADRLRILPYKNEPGATTATVRTEVKRNDGTLVPVNYSLHATPQGWMAWDVVIEGISYVKNYRTDFGAEIEQKGIDEVIQRLETQNASGKPDATAPGKGGKGG